MKNMIFICVLLGAFSAISADHNIYKSLCYKLDKNRLNQIILNGAQVACGLEQTDLPEEEVMQLTDEEKNLLEKITQNRLLYP